MWLGAEGVGEHCVDAKFECVTCGVAAVGCLKLEYSVGGASEFAGNDSGHDASHDGEDGDDGGEREREGGGGTVGGWMGRGVI